MYLSHANSAPLLRVEGVSKSFGNVPVLTDISLSIGAGEVVALVGENGAGKSTLIKLLLGKEQPDDGTITIGETVKMVSVGQERMDELDPKKTVYEEISNNLLER